MEPTPDPTALPTAEELDTWESEIKRLSQVGELNASWVLANDAHLLRLTAAARLVPVLMAEVEAWRRKAGSFGEITGTWYTNGSMIRVPVPEADSTDAALARAGKGEKR